MDNLVFSLNSTVPIFLIIVLGYFLRRIGIITEDFCSVADNFNYKIAIPVLLFNDISSSNFSEVFQFDFFLFCLIATILSIAAIWFLARRFLSDRAAVGAFVQGSYRGSIAVFGIAFLQNVYGHSGLAPLAVVAAAPLYNIAAVLILTTEMSSNKKLKTSDLILSVLKNPILDGVLIGMLFSFSGLTTPVILQKSISSVSSLATPLALIIIGAVFDWKKALGKFRYSLTASLIKLVFIPLVFLPFAIFLFGFRDAALVSALIMLASPNAPSSYIMAKNMGGDSVLASGTVVMTTLLSAFTLTTWMFVLRALNFI